MRLGPPARTQHSPAAQGSRSRNPGKAKAAQPSGFRACAGEDLTLQPHRAHKALTGAGAGMAVDRLRSHWKIQWTRTFGPRSATRRTASAIARFSTAGRNLRQHVSDPWMSVAKKTRILPNLSHHVRLTAKSAAGISRRLTEKRRAGWRLGSGHLSIPSVLSCACACGRVKLSLSRGVSAACKHELLPRGSRAGQAVGPGTTKAARTERLSHMRWRGLEPPRPNRVTRPSTLRVYQFRHQRALATRQSRAESRAR